MGLAAGSLRHFLEIHELVPVQDDTTGNFTETWPLFANCWGQVLPASVREFVGAGTETSKISIVVKVRYIQGLRRSMRIRHGERLYNIEGILPDPQSGIEFLTLPCSEVVGG